MSIEREPSEMNPDQLVDEALLLSEKLKQPYLNEARKEQVAHRLANIVFEYKYQAGEFDVVPA